MNKLFRYVFVPLYLLLSASIYGQGSLKGEVTDSLSDDPLYGANVYLIGTSLGTSADISGTYSLSRIPAGNYTLKVSYIGYKAKEFSIIINDKKTTILNINLIPDVISGEEIVITAQAIGQVAAINQQRASNTIINVVSEEKIKELPDANAAESIGRLPGVSLLRSGGEANKVILRGLSDKYTNVTIDGIKIPPTDINGRGLDLSTISQSSLAGIELYKALTPDKDADALAGSINLVTKKAPSLRELHIDVKGNYNDIMSSAKQYDFSLRYGERFFNDLIGLQLSGNLENRIRSSERVNLDYDQSIRNQTDYIINNFSLSFTDEIRERNGVSVILDFNTPDEGSVKFSNIYSGTKRDYLTSNRDYPSGGGTGGTVTYSFRDREQEIETFNSSLTGINNLLGFKLTWGLSYAQSLSDHPYDYSLNFLEPSITGTAGMKVTPTLQNNPEKLIPFAYNNFRAATLYSAFYESQRNFDKERNLFLNAAREYYISNLISGEVKIGGKYKTKYRSNLHSVTYAPYYLGWWQPYELGEDGVIHNKNLGGTYFDAFYNRYLENPVNNTLAFIEFLDEDIQNREIFNLYDLYPLINRDKLRQWYSLNKNGISQHGNIREYSNDPTAKADIYQITEDVSAGYLMNTLNIGQNLTFIAGLRLEQENNLYKSTYSPIQTGGFPIPSDATRDTSAVHKQTIILPNFHLNFKATEFLNIRIAAYKSIARPDFNYRLNKYFAWRGADVSSNKELILGNPRLKTAQAWNYEVNAAFYGNEIGLISVSAYYKEIKDMFHLLNGINTTGNSLIRTLGLDWNTLHNGTYALYVPYNSPQTTKVWGFELEHQMNFTFLPGLLKNIVLSYNASIVRSETFLIATRTDTITYFLDDFPGIPFYRYEDRAIEVKQQLEEQPKFYGNISLGYDIAGFSGRISLFHQSEYNLSFTPSGRGDQITNSFTRLDLAIRYKFTDYLSILLNVSNLTNIKEGNSIYNRVNNYKILNINERYGLTADFGVRIDL